VHRGRYGGPAADPALQRLWRLSPIAGVAIFLLAASEAWSPLAAPTLVERSIVNRAPGSAPTGQKPMHLGNLRTPARLCSPAVSFLETEARRPKVGSTSPPPARAAVTTHPTVTRPAAELQARISSLVVVPSWLHSLQSWSVRQTRSGSWSAPARSPSQSRAAARRASFDAKDAVRPAPSRRARRLHSRAASDRPRRPASS
jgi:hypothetical protein